MVSGVDVVLKQKQSYNFIYNKKKTFFQPLIDGLGKTHIKKFFFLVVGPLRSVYPPPILMVRPLTKCFFSLSLWGNLLADIYVRKNKFFFFYFPNLSIKASRSSWHENSINLLFYFVFFSGIICLFHVLWLDNRKVFMFCYNEGEGACFVVKVSYKKQGILVLCELKVKDY